MPSITGGDQLDEDYAPHHYVARVFVGEKNIMEKAYKGKKYRVARHRRKILAERDGKVIESLPKPIEEAFAEWEKE